jgi:hypothetical protein
VFLAQHSQLRRQQARSPLSQPHPKFNFPQHHYGSEAIAIEAQVIESPMSEPKENRWINDVNSFPVELEDVSKTASGPNKKVV